MRKRKLLSNIWTFFCGFIFLILCNITYSYLIQVSYTTFNSGIQELALFVILILFGFMLGMERFISEKRSDGFWSIDVLRMFILLVPCFILTIWIWLPKLLLIFNVNFSLQIPAFLFLPNMDIRLVKLLFPILLGYLAITTIVKNKK